MKRLLILLLLLSICPAVWAQYPQFIQGLKVDQPAPCPGEPVTLYAQVRNATMYEFQLLDKEAATWIRLSSGDLDTSSTSVQHVIHSVYSSFTSRLVLYHNSEHTVSAPVEVYVNAPLFVVEPADVTACNGSKAFFYAYADNALHYQWESSSDGHTFSVLTETTKFKGVGSPSLEISGLLNSHHQLQFRCKITDSQGCEFYTRAATLHVNQMSTAVSPTTAISYCEGDTVQFYPATIVGEPLSFSWWMRKKNTSSYALIDSSARFFDVDSRILEVRGILPDENSFRVRVAFPHIQQQSDGSQVQSTCFLESTRASYTVRRRPLPPQQLDSLARCGSGSFTLKAPMPYFWYQDTLQSPLASQASTFTTPYLDTSTVYYYSLKDEFGCESYRMPVKTTIHPIPTQSFNVPEGLCANQESLNLQLLNVEHSPLHFIVEYTSIGRKDSLTPEGLAAITLPPLAPKDTLDFQIHSTTAFCSSDTLHFRLPIYQPTALRSLLSPAHLCANDSLHLEVLYEAEAPLQFTWMHDNVPIEGQNSAILHVQNLEPHHAGSYKASVKGRCGYAETEPFTLTLTSPPKLIEHPKNTVVCEGDEATFQVQVDMGHTVRYQWYFNDTPIGENSHVLRISTVPISANGSKIHCTILSQCQRVLHSDTAMLLVNTLPTPPSLSDTLFLCASSEMVQLPIKSNSITWYNAAGQIIDSPLLYAESAHKGSYFATHTDTNGCTSTKRKAVVWVTPGFSLTALAEQKVLCPSGNFNRTVHVGALSNSPSPITFTLLQNGLPLDSNQHGQFYLHQPGNYEIRGVIGPCSSFDRFTISSHPELPTPPVLEPLHYCPEKTISLEVPLPAQGVEAYWWDHPSHNSGLAIGHTIATSDSILFVSYGANMLGTFCESERVQIPLKALPAVQGGLIASLASAHCAGYNPPVIQNIQPPQHATHFQWQYTESEHLSSWSNIPDATQLTYNPGTLRATTYFRRVAWNSCDTSYSNPVTITIFPDPSIEIVASSDTIGFGETVLLLAELHGGAGHCEITWQMNRVSGASSNPNWINVGLGHEFLYTNADVHGSIYFRARVVCDIASCNQAISAPLRITALPPPTPLRIKTNVQQITACLGNTVVHHVDSEGQGVLVYRWQRKLPGESLFRDITDDSHYRGATTATLRIANAGSAESPHLSQYRCKVSDRFDSVTSVPTTLFINRILGNLPNLSLCEGASTIVDLQQHFAITGTPIDVQWQQRPGVGSPWQNVRDSAYLSGSNSFSLTLSELPQIPQQQFRSVLRFATESGSCNLTTDLMTVKVIPIPPTPENIGLEICQFQKLGKIQLYPPDDVTVRWYHLNDSVRLSRQPDIDQDVPGNHFLHFSFSRQNTCESPRALVHVIVHEAPSSPTNTTPEVYDRSDTLVFSAIGENLKWYRSQSTLTYDIYPPTFIGAGKNTYYVTQTDQRGCESKRIQIQSQMLPPFAITVQPKDQITCEGNNATFSVRTVGGTNVSYQWEQEINGTFIPIEGSTQRDLTLSQGGTSMDANGTRFRCAVQSLGNVLFSEPAVLHINRLATNIPHVNLCSGESLTLSQFEDAITGSWEKMEWQVRTGSTYTTVAEGKEALYLPPPGEAGTYRLRVTFRSSSGTCVRNSNAIMVQQHPQPTAPPDTSFHLCRFDNQPTFRLEGTVKWQGKHGEWLDSLPVSTLVEKELYLRYKKVDSNGCSSPRAHARIQIMNCYFPGLRDTVVHRPILQPQNSAWDYLTFWNGAIFGAVNKANFRRKNIPIHFSSISTPAFEDRYGNHFLPRQLALIDELPKPLQVRLYFSHAEMESYPYSPEAPWVLLHRKTTALDTITWWTGDTLNIQQERGHSFYFAQFQAKEVGEYRVTRMHKPAGYLIAGKDTRGYPLLMPGNLSGYTPGQFRLLKSKDGKNWEETPHIVQNDIGITDDRPHSPITFYRLDFLDAKNIRSVVDSAHAWFANELPACSLMQNPVTLPAAIRLRFPGLQKERTRLMDARGETIPLQVGILPNGGFSLSPLKQLAQGIYYLTAESSSGQSCVKKIIAL